MCGSGRQALVWSVVARRRSRMCIVSQSVSQYQYGAHRRCVEDGEERVEGVEERKEEPLPTSPTYPALTRCSPFGPLP